MTKDLAGCASKQGFKNPQQAAKVMQRTNRNRSTSLNTYRCSCCDLVHIGTPSRSRH